MNKQLQRLCEKQLNGQELRILVRALWHRMAGTPLDVLKELGGWSSYEMVFRYTYLSNDHLHEFAQNFNQIVTNSLHSKKGNAAKIA